VILCAIVFNVIYGLLLLIYGWSVSGGNWRVVVNDLGSGSNKLAKLCVDSSDSWLGLRN